MKDSPERLASRADQRVVQSRAVIVESKKRIRVARDHIDRSRAVMEESRRRMAGVRVNLE